MTWRKQAFFGTVRSLKSRVLVDSWILADGLGSEQMFLEYALNVPGNCTVIHYQLKKAGTCLFRKEFTNVTDASAVWIWKCSWPSTRRLKESQWGGWPFILRFCCSSSRNQPASRVLLQVSLLCGRHERKAGDKNALTKSDADDRQIDLEMDYSAKSERYGKWGLGRQVWIVWAQFCTVHYINDAEHFPGAATLKIKRLNNPTENSLYFCKMCHQYRPIVLVV